VLLFIFNSPEYCTVEIMLFSLTLKPKIALFQLLARTATIIHTLLEIVTQSALLQLSRAKQQHNKKR